VNKKSIILVGFFLILGIEFWAYQLKKLKGKKKKGFRYALKHFFLSIGNSLCILQGYTWAPQRDDFVKIYVPFE
jgi:hypothetical protein